MSNDARATLERSKEGKQFLDVVAKCSDKEIIPALIAAGARLLTVTGKENVPSGAGPAPDLSSALLSIKGLSFINPRGKFDITFTKEAMVLSNAKSSIIVPTSAVTHVAILDQIPQDTKKRCLLFIVLDRNGPAVMNGKQRLDAVIIQTLESDTTSTTATTGEVLDGPTVAVLCQAVGLSIPNFTNFLAPDPNVFKTSRGHVAVSAVVKVNQGHLFPLPGALLFVERPALFLPLGDVLAVEYRRAQSATFDLVLHTRGRDGEGGSGGDSVQEVEFSQVDRGDLGRLQSYFAASKIKLYDPAAPPRPGPVPSAAGADAAIGSAGGAAGDAVQGDGDDSDEDEDEEEDEDFDPRALQRLEARQRPSKRQRTGPSSSVAASNQPGGSGAGPSGSRMREREEDVGASDEDEDEDEEGEGSEDEDSSDEDDDLADLTDEDDLAADAVRKRVKGAAGGGGGGNGSTAAAGNAAKKRGRADSEEEEDDDEEEDDEE